MRDLLFCMVGLYASSLTAQPTFSKLYNSPGTAKLNLCELSNGNLLTGIAAQSGTSLMDAEGNILHAHNYAVDTFLVLQSVERYADNQFFFTASYWKDSCAETGGLRFYPVIGEMDSLGNIVRAHHYVLNSLRCLNGAGDLAVMHDGSVIAWGVDDRWFFAIKVDAAGEVVWAKRMEQWGAVQFVKELPGGDVLVGMNMETAGAVVARMDPDGEFVWCKSYIRPKGVVHDAVVESDDSFVVIGITDSIRVGGGVLFPPPSDFDPKLFMMKLNGAGDVQWCKGFDAEHKWISKSISRLVRSQDDNYVVLGNMWSATRPRPVLMKTDPNGDTLWTRSYGVSAYAYDIGSLLAYSDGGFLFNGQCYLCGMYLFKTDQHGHLPCYEQSSPALEILDLFPTDSAFTLLTVDGATKHPAFITDTVYPPLNVVDGCTVTAVPSRTPRSFSIRPNPNTGHFTVQFADPLLAESYYSVYDTMGKLLLQRRLPTGATAEEVDLVRFGAGTYVIKFTSPDGVCHERVVVE